MQLYASHVGGFASFSRESSAFSLFCSGGILLEFPASNTRLFDRITVSSSSSSFSAAKFSSKCSENGTAVFCRSPSGKEGESLDLHFTTSPDVNFTRGASLRVVFVKNPQFKKLDSPLTVRSTSEITLQAKEVRWYLNFEFKM